MQINSFNKISSYSNNSRDNKQNVNFKGFKVSFTKDELLEAVNQSPYKKDLELSDKNIKSYVNKLWKNIEFLKEKFSKNKRVNVSIDFDKGENGTSILANVRNSDEFSSKYPQFSASSGVDFEYNHVFSNGNALKNTVLRFASEREERYKNLKL